MKIFFQIILTLLFIALSILFIFTKGIENTLLETEFYEELLEATDISTALKENILISFEEIEPDENLKDIKKTREEVEMTLERVFDREWLNGTALYLVGDLLAYIKGEREIITARVDISTQKRALEQILEDDKEDDNILNEIPDEIVLKDILEDNNFLSKIDVFRAYYDFYRIAIYSLLIALFLIIMVLAKPINGMKWNGFAMISAGLFVLLNLIIYKKVLQTFALDMTDITTNIDNINEINNILVSRFYPVIYFYLIFGILLVLASIIIKKYKKS